MSPFEHPLALVLIVGGIFLAVAIVVWDHHQTPARTAGDREPSSVRGTTRQQCTTTGCGYPASALVVESQDLGGATRLVCKGCADEGAAHRWWEFVGDAS